MRRRRSGSPTTRATASTLACGPATSSAASPSRGASRAATPASTSAWCPRGFRVCPSEASSRVASGRATAAPRGCDSSACGRRSSSSRAAARRSRPGSRTRRSGRGRSSGSWRCSTAGDVTRVRLRGTTRESGDGRLRGLLREPSRLSHGALTVLFEPAPGPLTAIAVAVRAGARFDGALQGIAHMAEHMLFQGTPRLDQAALNRRAGELGGEHDADTGYEDMTLHFEVFDEDVEEALTLLAEQLFHSTVPADRFAKERRVVIDEIRGRQEDPANAVHEQAWSRFFGGPLGHPICGTIKSVRRITPADVRRFVARQFVPAKMALALVGGASPARVRRALARMFPTHGARSTPWPRLPRGTAKRSLRMRRQDLAQSYLVRIAAAPPDARSVLSLSLALEIVGADPDARP